MKVIKQPNCLVETDQELLSRLFAQLKEKDLNDLSSLEQKMQNLQLYSFVDLLNYASGPECDAALALTIEEMMDRLRLTEPQRQVILTSSQEVGSYLASKLIGRKQEEFWALYLDNGNHLLAEKRISQGTLNRAIAHPRDVFHWAVIYSAAAIIVAHNHPSGRLNPSPSDLKMTAGLQAAAKMMKIDLLDHFIVGKGHYFSMRENQIF